MKEHIPEKLMRFYHILPYINFKALQKGLELSDERVALLQAIIREEYEVDHLYSLLDIRLACLKLLFREEYLKAKVQPHANASGELYTYDPAKNGLNLIKHGLTFNEVASFSPAFGALTVPCPDSQDGVRMVILSKLFIPEPFQLILPTSGLESGEDLSTLSIAVFREGRYRFISSRILREDGWEAHLKGAVKNIYAGEGEAALKQAFLKQCKAAVREHLFGNRDSKETPIRIIRPV